MEAKYGLGIITIIRLVSMRRARPFIFSAIEQATGTNQP